MRAFSTPTCSALYKSALIVMLSSSDDNPRSGQEYSLNCTVTLPPGQPGPPIITWMDSSGDVTGNATIPVGVVTGKDLIYTSILTFDTLWTSYGGEYTCMATLSSISATSLITISMQRECTGT